MRGRMRAAAAALAFLTADGAAAQSQNPFGGFKHDSTQPIEISADALEVAESERRAVFTGEVVAGQGTLRLTADALTVWYATEGGGEDGGSGRIDRVRAEGDVFLSSGAETARGDWAEYDVSSGEVPMGGGVTLAQGDNAVSGERLFVDLNAGRGRIEGGRVRSVFSPTTADQ